MSQRQYLRKASLLMVTGDQAIDLSDFHFRFHVSQEDVGTPTNALIRVWNLRPETMKRVRGEGSRVVIQAGYEGGAFGIVFDGTVKQFGIGKENATDVFLDIKAADGDLGFTTGLISRTFAAGTSPREMMDAAALSMGLKLVDFPNNTFVGDLARGRVLFGMARAAAQGIADTVLSTWSFTGGQLQVIPLSKYKAGEAVVINSMTGMIGIPEQTDQGVKVRCLLNPRIGVGARIRLNNKDITQQDVKSVIPFNVRVGILNLAPLAEGADGEYRVLVHDITGDTRGQEWYSDLVGLAIRPSSPNQPVAPYG